MYVLTSYITIGKYNFKEITNVEIERTSRLLIDVAKIEMPLSFTLENKQRLTTEKAIKRGDKVLIKLGYNGELQEEFSGFVSKIKADKNKVIIQCEDNGFLLRKNINNKAFGKTTLKEILQYVANECSVELNENIVDINFEKFVLRNVTGLQVLKKLKENYGLTAFFDYHGKLFVGLTYTYKTGQVVYDLQRNIIKSNLEFKNEADIRIKIRAISILKNNSRIEVELGDEDGELRTLYFYNITSEKELKELAKEQIKQLKYTGYRGNITAFGLPIAKFGMTAKIKDSNYPQREGLYYVESVKIRFGQNGFRRIIELGPKL